MMSKKSISGLPDLHVRSPANYEKIISGLLSGVYSIVK
jgi:hypothetical protein